MKTLFTLVSALLLCAGLTTSCDLDSKNERHQTLFFPQSPRGRILYAVQTLDTLRVFSYDSWRLTGVYEQPKTEWFSVTPDKADIPANYVGNHRISIRTTPNTTATTRTGGLRLVTTFAEFGTLGMPVRQLSYLNILRPVATFPLGTDGKPSTQPVFIETVAATASTDNHIDFVLYDENTAAHTLTSNAAWLTIGTIDGVPVVVYPGRIHLYQGYSAEEVIDSGLKAGKNVAKLNIEANLATTPRTATLTLTSAGVSNVITITQQGKK